MSASGSSSHGADADADARWALVGRILESRHLKKSERLKQLLLYIAEQSIAQDHPRLSEKRIGCEVFGKSPDYSPLDDNSVRVHARLLRQRVEAYFQDEGADESLRLDIPRGGYEAVFREQVPAAPPPQSGPRITRAGFLLRSGWAAAVFLLVALIGVLWRFSSPGTFVPSLSSPPPWPFSEVFDSSRPNLIIVADDVIYWVDLAIGKGTTRQDITLEEYLAPGYPRNLLPANADPRSVAIVEMAGWLRSTPVEGALAAARILEISGSYRKSTSIRSARDLRLVDIERANCVILGFSHTNMWASIFEPVLNFALLPGADGNGAYFLNKAPKPGELATYATPRPRGEGGATFGVAALLRSKFGGKVLLIQGSTAEATGAIGMYLADHARSKDLQAALTGSAGKSAYFEALFRTRVLGHASTDTQFIATRLH